MTCSFWHRCLSSWVLMVLLGALWASPAVAVRPANDIVECDFYRSTPVITVVAPVAAPVPSPSPTPSTSPSVSATPSVTTSPPSPQPPTVRSHTPPVNGTGPASSLLPPLASPARASSPDPAGHTQRGRQAPAVKHTAVKLSEGGTKQDTEIGESLSRSPREPPQSEASSPARSRTNSQEDLSDHMPRRLSMDAAPPMATLGVSRSFTPHSTPKKSKSPSPDRPTGMRKLLAFFKASKDEKKGEEKKGDDKTRQGDDDSTNSNSSSRSGRREDTKKGKKGKKLGRHATESPEVEKKEKTLTLSSK